MERSAFPFVFLEERVDAAPQGRALAGYVLRPPTSLASCVREIAWVCNRARSLHAAHATGALRAFRLNGLATTGDQRIPEVSLTGLQTRVRDYAYRGETTSVLVRLTAQGARMPGVHPRGL
jgi:hypothetical protein